MVGPNRQAGYATVRVSGCNYLEPQLTENKHGLERRESSKSFPLKVKLMLKST